MACHLIRIPAGVNFGQYYPGVILEFGDTAFKMIRRMLLRRCSLQPPSANCAIRDDWWTDSVADSLLPDRMHVTCRRHPLPMKNMCVLFELNMHQDR